MARATTAKYEEMILEVEFDPVGASGTYTTICGMIDVSISRTSQVDESEIPDCADESLPLAIERQVRSQSVTVTASGVWALESNDKLLDWWRSGATLSVKMTNTKAEDDGATGEIYAETGPALLASLNNSRTKGQKVTAEIELQFDGVPTTTAVPA